MDIKDFCTALGSTAPTPGGGSAAGITLSLGAACLEKAMRFSLAEEHDAFIERCIAIRESGFEFSRLDEENFTAWQKARKLPKETEEEKKERQEKVNFYAAECARVPLELGKKCFIMLELIEEFLPSCNAFLISDAAVGASHAGAAFESAIFNIMINLPYVKDEALINDLKNFMNDTVVTFTALKEKLLRECEKKLQK